jgi:hypothetical protein
MSAKRTSTGQKPQKMALWPCCPAVAYDVMIFSRSPSVVPEIRSKDIIIVIAAFIYGPLSACSSPLWSPL